MKKVFLPLTALLLAFYSCNNAPQQNSDNASDTTKISIPEPKDDAPVADPSVDWDKPLFTIDTETGDTITKWLYTDTSIVETSIYTEASYGYEGDETTVYDLKGRIISQCGTINSGNIHNYPPHHKKSFPLLLTPLSLNYLAFPEFHSKSNLW